MAMSYSEAVRNGTQAAGRIHRDLHMRSRLESRPGSVEVFGIIAELGLPLLLRPLQGLLGAYLDAPTPGLLVTTERPLSIQRFTAAHELGHCLMKHKPSLDDEEQILRRGPARNLNQRDARNGFQEAEADAFAVALLMPKWLIQMHCGRQGWKTADLSNAAVVYQLSLRLGVSYEALARTLDRYSMVDPAIRDDLLKVRPRALKAALLGDYAPPSFHGDVWRLTERDQGALLDGRSQDHVVVELRELGAAGYLWDIAALTSIGMIVHRDERTDATDGVGGPNLRRLVATSGKDAKGQVELHQRRPWQPKSSLEVLMLQLDFTGPETLGLSRAERKLVLEAA